MHVYIRGNGRAASRSWPTSEKLERLRNEWLFTPELTEQKRVAGMIQQQVFADVPYVPLGQILPPRVVRRDVVDLLSSYALFWNLRKT